MSFQSCLQPMLTWMRCIGVYLESPNNKAPLHRCRCIIICFGVIAFFLNVLSNFMQITILTFELGKPKTWDYIKSQRFTSTRIWANVITNLNHTFLTIGSHSSLLMSAHSTKWIKLIEVLRKMEKDSVFQQKDYTKFCAIFIFGYRFLVMAVIGLLILVSTIGSPKYQTTLLSLLGYTFQSVLGIYMFSGAVWFCCLGWMAAIQFTILAQKVKQAEESRRNRNRNNWSKKIETWRHQNYLISDLVDNISHCYGSFLFVMVTYSFIIMINSSFMFLTNFLGEKLETVDSTLYLTLFFIQLSCFSLVVYVPHRLRESALQFSKRLRNLQLADPELENKVNFLIVEVLHSLPKISALGLFDVNLRLIPTLTGTTLTYLIILCQFQYSEQ